MIARDIRTYISKLFDAVTGHNHSGPGQGAPILSQYLTLMQNTQPLANQLTTYSVAKAWARVTVSAGVPTLANGFNVGSITDGGVGDLTVTWNVAIANEVGAVLVSIEGNAMSCEINTVSSTAVRVNARVLTTAVLVDPVAWHIVAFGRQ